MVFPLVLGMVQQTFVQGLYSLSLQRETFTQREDHSTLSELFSYLP